jgi:hypothetical protein
MQWNVSEENKNDVIEIWQINQLVQELSKTRQIAFFCDLHGIFMFILRT